MVGGHRLRPATVTFKKSALWIEGAAPVAQSPMDAVSITVG